MSAIAKQIERREGVTSPMVGKYPTVRAGICDRCGVMDPNYPSIHQYKLCPHYRGKQLACSYCPNTVDPDEVIAHSIMEIYDSPTNPNELVVHCNHTTCLDKHYKRFQANA